ncbi:MAG: CRTAC1 family protein [Acidobacteria bacterium]|nr:CRTAC1 family protein [Acidobacteriota bacterium]
MSIWKAGASTTSVWRRRSWLRFAAGGVLAPILPWAEKLLAATAPFQFADTAGAAGLGRARNQSGPAVDKQTLLEEMGQGVALVDYDNDGWLDIFLVNGNAAPCFLFRNNRDGTFTDVSRQAGIADTAWGQGCCAGDYDNDGFTDIFVSGWNRNRLYRNNGDGTFTEVARKAGVAGVGHWGAGCCFLDYNRDGLLDLFVASYVRFDPASAPKPGAAPSCRNLGLAVPCGPVGFSGGANSLYRNRGDGTFEDVSESSGIAQPRGAAKPVFAPTRWQHQGSYGMGAVAADFDNDGWPDIYVACDTAPSLLYRNNHDGTFREVATPAGCALDENGAALGGMGAATGDLDGDGWLDLVRTNFHGQTTTVYRNNRNGTFHDASLGSGLGVNRQYVGFGLGVADFDHDAEPDLFIANGHVYAQLATIQSHVKYRQRRLLYRNNGLGRFTDVSAQAGAGIQAEHASRGCALGDLDNDGSLEIVVNNIDESPSLLRNRVRPAGNALLVRCTGVKSNRSAIGTRVRVTVGSRVRLAEITSGSGYYSHNDLRLHFGLGSATQAGRIDIRWPSGLEEVAVNVTANQILHFEEGRGLVRKEPFRR